MLISMSFSIKPPLVLTHDWNKDHNQIKYIPSILKEIVSQGEHLEHTLYSEYDDKDEVDPVQDFFSLFALVVLLQHHSDHVQTDQAHDNDVKVLLCDNVVQKALKTILQDSGNNEGIIQLVISCQITHIYKKGYLKC